MSILRREGRSRGIKCGKRRKELLAKYGRRERNRVKDVLHKVSKTIMEFAKVRGCGIILEDLKGIRKRIDYNRVLNRRLHSWSFRKLQSYIEYKAKLEGLPVVYVNPKDTSSRCPICEGKLSSNGTWRIKICEKCGVVWNRDFVACLNLLRMWRVCVTAECSPMNMEARINLPSVGNVKRLTVPFNYPP